MAFFVTKWQIRQWFFSIESVWSEKKKNYDLYGVIHPNNSKDSFNLRRFGTFFSVWRYLKFNQQYQVVNQTKEFYQKAVSNVLNCLSFHINGCENKIVKPEIVLKFSELCLPNLAIISKFLLLSFVNENYYVLAIWYMKDRSFLPGEFIENKHCCYGESRKSQKYINFQEKGCQKCHEFLKKWLVPGKLKI